MNSERWICSQGRARAFGQKALSTQSSTDWPESSQFKNPSVTRIWRRESRQIATLLRNSLPDLPTLRRIGSFPRHRTNSTNWFASLKKVRGTKEDYSES